MKQKKKNVKDGGSAKKYNLNSTSFGWAVKAIILFLMISLDPTCYNLLLWLAITVRGVCNKKTSNTSSNKVKCFKVVIRVLIAMEKFSFFV